MIDKRTHITDRRTQRTQNSLREALHSLIGEKSYDSIVVKEILDRANVGRSTFYTHFRDKDELLVSSIREMVHSAKTTGLPRSGKWYERIVWFSMPIFEYHYRHRRKAGAKMGPKGRALLHEHLQRVLSEMIEHALRVELQRSRKAVRLISPELLVEYVASTFILVLDWWLESKSQLSPAEVNDLFRALIFPALATI